MTLAEIGEALGVTRERARQLERAAREQLDNIIEDSAPHKFREFSDALDREPFIAEQDLRRYLPSKNPARSAIMAQALGAVHPIIWSRKLVELWTTDSSSLADSMSLLVEAAPCNAEDMASLADTLDFPSGFDFELLLGLRESPLRKWRKTGWWVRKRAKKRDAVYLWLLSEGEPKTASVVADWLGDSAHASRESLRRDDRFVQLRPSGLWSLIEWDLPGSTGPRNATSAVRTLLEDRGPMALPELLIRMRDFYPVTSWRISQVLKSSQFGTLPDGRVALVSDGATHAKEPEPEEDPSVSIHQDSGIIGYKLVVDSDLERGSGLAVPAFLAWSLGLETIPSRVAFLEEVSNELVTVRRNTSNNSISSLRLHAERAGAQTGCALAVLFRPEEKTVKIIHGCAAENCPGRAS